ncbi:MAG: hypothetical protein C4536_06435 [Actinobacteria bacterium]|nr:MAG: hypothetical protein C4536_06435 [Actinomycetota bacterium]
MVWIIITTYPMSGIAKAIEIYLDQQQNNPVPDWIEEIGFYSQWGGDGVRNWQLIKCPDDKWNDALKELIPRNLRYGEIEGFKIEYEITLPVMEAIAAAGGQ